MADTLDISILKSLAVLEDQFFPALQGSTAQLEAFAASWISFSAEVETCLESLQHETRTMIFSFAETTNIVLPGLLEINIASDEFQRQLEEELLGFVDLSISEAAPSGGQIHSFPIHLNRILIFF